MKKQQIIIVLAAVTFFLLGTLLGLSLHGSSYTFSFNGPTRSLQYDHYGQQGYGYEPFFSRNGAGSSGNSGSSIINPGGPIICGTPVRPLSNDNSGASNSTGNTCGATSQSVPGYDPPVRTGPIRRSSTLFGHGSIPQLTKKFPGSTTSNN